MRRFLGSSRFYFALAILLVLAAVASQFDLRLPSRAGGSRADIRALAERDDLNVLFILVDTLRSDHLSTYGYERPTSPMLDTLAATGVRFDSVVAQSSWTKSSMASLWTGTYPVKNQITRFEHALPDAATMPAELFREAGYRTGGIYRNGWLDTNFGFGQGFELYVKPAPSRTPERFERRSPGTHRIQGTDLDATQSAQQFLRTHRDERWFLYVHYMDLHQYLFDNDSALFGTAYADAYDNAIHWTDRNVRILIAELEELGLMERTVVVIASDHGEAFYEHGREGHARDLYREVTETPFLITLPFALDEPLVIDERVRNIDIWPTVLDLVGLPPLPGAQGRSLVPWMAGEVAWDPQRAFGSLDQSWGVEDLEPEPLVAVTDGSQRLIYYGDGKKPHELFDHARDPREQTDRAAQEPERVAELSAAAEAYLADNGAPWGGAPKSVEISEMRKGVLRALGYVVETKEGPRRTPAAEAEVEARRRAQERVRQQAAE